MKNRGRWRVGALASAVALLASLSSLEAHALALGRITVQSALGEPLRAEIDIADINTAEAASLKAKVASPETFKAAGLEYTAVLSQLDISLQRRPDGRAYFKLSSSRSVTEPYMDLILETSWASGRLTRDYTLLLDPPGMRANAPVAPTAPILSRPAPLTRAEVDALRAPATRPAQVIPDAPSTPTSPPVAKEPTPPPRVVAKPVPVAPSSTAGQEVQVKVGDTAGKIAAQNKPTSVSLDQMLVAMLKSNPSAFIGGNINRIKAGAVLDLPSEAEAQAISATQARQTIVAQSKDFNSFRRKLADNVSTTDVAGPDRQAAGKIDAQVQDRAATSTTPDKLTLSKGAVKGKAAEADKIAKERQAQDANARVAELSKNISDLNKLTAAPGTPAATAANPAATSAPVVPGVTVPVAAVPAPVAVPASAPVEATPDMSAAAASAATAAAAAVAAPLATASDVDAATTTDAQAPATVASEPVVVAAPVIVKPTPPAPMPVAEPSMLDEVLDNPLTLPLGAALLALLAGFGFYRFRQQKKGSDAVDSSFLESRLQPDSFFGATGGQRVDTSESHATGSSLVYSASQLDAAGDVDPVAEADVYLAYGRDLQAEEILKEAIRANPTRVAIHVKLMEIYAKRRDTHAFEKLAVEAFALTQGTGSVWAYVCEMGQEVDPSNAMYQAGGQPNTAPPVVHAQPAYSAPDTMPVAPYAVAAAAAPGAMDLDLDLDFSLDDAPVARAPASAAAPQASNDHDMDLSMDMDMGMDLDLGVDFPSATAAAPSRAAAPVPEVIDFSANVMEFTPEDFAPAPYTPPASKVAPAPALDSGLLEFDMGDLSLDLDPAPVAASPRTAALEADGSNPLVTKFELAEEFRALGDVDGARTLAEEVLLEAEGPLKVKTQAFLNALV